MKNNIEMYRDMLIEARDKSQGLEAVAYQNAIDLMDSVLLPIDREATVTRVTILGDAMKYVCNDREQVYGAPEENFNRIARLWEAYMRGACVNLDSDLRIIAQDVAVMMALVKIARISSGNFKADNWIDIAGYAALGGEIEAATKAAMESAYQLAIDAEHIGEEAVTS